MSRYLVLSLAKGQVFQDPNFWHYIESLHRIPDADYVLLSDDAPGDVVERLKTYGVRVATADPITNIFRDRHLAYWKFLAIEGDDYEQIVITDCRDVIFQRSPFVWSAGGLRGQFVAVTSEGFKASRSGFACIDHFKFQADLPAGFAKDIGDQMVVNGGVSIGTQQALMAYHLLIWALMLKTRGQCTDQAAINYALSILLFNDDFYVAYVDDWLCLTGESVKEGVVSPLIGNCLMNQDGIEFCILHQWDRLPEAMQKIVLAKLR